MKNWRYPLILILLVVMLTAPVVAITWRTETVDSSGSGALMAVDAAGNPRILYTRDGGFKVAKWTGSVWEYNTISSIPIIVGEEFIRSISPAVDTSGNPHVVYTVVYHHVDNAQRYLKYAKWTGSSWDIQDFGPIGSQIFQTDSQAWIVLDAADNPHFATDWQTLASNTISFEGLSLSQDVSFRGIALNAAGNPLLCVRGSIVVPSGVRYLTRNGIIHGPGPTSFQLDSAENPHIIYTDSGAVKYAKWTGSDWETSTVGNGVTPSLEPVVNGIIYSLQLDAADIPSLVYTDSGAVKYAKWTGSDWETSTVGNGVTPSLKLDTAGNPHVVYYDSGAVMYATITINEPPVAIAGPDQTVIVNEPVIFDGSGSSDSDGTIVTYAWNFGDTKTSSGMTTSHTFTSAGTYTVILTVTDNGGLSGSDTTVIIVKTPTEAVQDLITNVDGLGLPKGIEQGLLAKLDVAEKKIAQKQYTPARNTLKAFINQVSAQRGKALTGTQADELIAIAERIITSIPGK